MAIDLLNISGAAVTAPVTIKSTDNTVQVDANNQTFDLSVSLPPRVSISSSDSSIKSVQLSENRFDLTVVGGGGGGCECNLPQSLELYPFAQINAEVSYYTDNALARLFRPDKTFKAKFAEYYATQAGGRKMLIFVYELDEFFGSIGKIMGFYNKFEFMSSVGVNVIEFSYENIPNSNGEYILFDEQKTYAVVLIPNPNDRILGSALWSQNNPPFRFNVGTENPNMTAEIDFSGWFSGSMHIPYVRFF